MKKIKLIFLKLAVLGLNFLYTFFKIFPTKNKITFISRQSNKPSRDIVLLSQALNDKLPDYEIVILTKKMKNFTYIFHMFKQMYHIATSKIVILDTYCIAISVLHHKKSLTVIQMWHAIGSMKKFGYAMLGKPEGRNPDVARILKMHKNYDYLFISSNSFIKDYLEGFKCQENQIVELPLPRIDMLLDKKYQEKEKKRLYKKFPVLKDKQNILYCPTFRKDSNLEIKNVKKLIDCIDFKKYNFIYKPHPLSKVKFEDERIMTKFKDTYEALSIADYVICDYSSIIYEVGLLNLPIYLYAYDWDIYKKKREINFDIEHEVPTLFTKNPQEIINAIENNIFDYKSYKKFVNKNIKLPKNKTCTDAIVEFIFNILSNKK